MLLLISPPSARAGQCGRTSRHADPSPAGRGGGRGGGDSARRMRHRTQLPVPQARQRLPLGPRPRRAFPASSISSSRKSARFARAASGATSSPSWSWPAATKASARSTRISRTRSRPRSGTPWLWPIPGGYSPIAAYERRNGKDKGPLSRFDDCRAFERHAAYGALDRLCRGCRPRSARRSATA